MYFIKWCELTEAGAVGLTLMVFSQKGFVHVRTSLPS